MQVLVLGAGVIGAAIAYRLAVRGVAVTVVERTGVACAASGKAGGFLALDWCDGTPLQGLARRSFALHAELAEELGNTWGYRRLTTYAGAVGRDAPARVAGRSLPWVAPTVRIDGRLGSPETTAQVHPGLFTKAMMRAATARGAVLRQGEATGLLWQDGRVFGAEVDGAPIRADAVVVALGPWSILAARWLPLPPVFGLKGHSLVFDTGDRVPPESLFLETADPPGSMLSPEVFPRADGTTYVCAISSKTPLPLDPAAVAPDEGAIERLRALCGRIAPALRDAPVLAEQACFRPVTQDGLPLIGAVHEAPGAYVATGHSVWGILNAPATAEALAELIFDGGSTSVDLEPFDPARLPPLAADRLTTVARRTRPAAR